MAVISSIAKYRKSSAQGFTLIEVLVAAFVLTAGLLAVVTVFSSSLLIVKFSEQDSIARQQAQQMIEGIYAARNTGAIPFAAIRNKVDDPANGIFQSGFTPATQPGNDGIMNTLDDSSSLVVGPSGQPLANFKRSIQINQITLQDGVTIDTNVRQVQLSIQYHIGNMTRTYSQTTYISRFR